MLPGPGYTNWVPGPRAREKVIDDGRGPGNKNTHKSYILINIKLTCF